MFRNRPLISNYYRTSLEKIRSEITRENDATIIGTSINKLSEYYFQKYALPPILFDETQESSWEHEKYTKTIRAHEREEFHQSEGDLDFECEKVRVEIPILLNDNVKTITDLRSSTYSVSYSENDFFFLHDKIGFSLETKGYGFSYDENKIAQNIKSKIGEIKQLVSRKNSDIEGENAKLKQDITRIISERTQKLKQDEEKISSLTKMIGIPLKKRENPVAKNIRLSQKPIVKKVKPSPTQPEEYVLSSDVVIGIISFLDNQGKQFEKTPKSYETLGEEALRDILLVNLNAIFEGKATGETFSKKGKSDIYLNIDKGSILIFECKIWKGEELYHDAIDQLRKYLTWRHNFGVVITFVRNKGFSDVIEKMEEVIQKNKSYINGYRKIDETHFVSNHVVEEDKKEVEVHHLFYNLYAG